VVSSEIGSGLKTHLGGMERRPPDPQSVTGASPGSTTDVDCFSIDPVW